MARFSLLATARASVSSISELFPEPETPVTQVNVPSGKRKSTSCRLCCRAPKSSIQPPPGGSLSPPGFHPPRVGNRDLFAARKVLSRERGGRSRDSFGVPCGGDRPAEAPGPRTEIVESVGGREDFAVVLDQDDGIAQIAQPPKRFQQPIVVAGMQADRRLVEDVQDARQSAADLSGQADSLRLAARKRRQRAGQRQIVEPDVDQKGQPAGRFVQQVARDLALGRRELRLAFKSASDSLKGSEQS